MVVSGPTAVGKGTVVGRLRRLHPEVFVSVSATTRAPRPNEIDGVHYLFVNDAEFDRMIAEHELLEWAVVHGTARYGTPSRPVHDAVRRGQNVILEIDLQGARQVRASCPGAMFVFLMPPSFDELRRRLTGRGTETAEQQQRRLATAHEEIKAQSEFDHIVVNADIGRAAEDLIDLLGR